MWALTRQAGDMYLGDNLEIMSAMPTDSVDLVIGSPPYEDARDYGLGFKLKGQAWVDWMMERWIQMQRISRGMVVMVAEGRTQKFRWSATPALLMADLHRAGMNLRKPPIYHRIGIPGSGGPDYWRNDYEFCILTSKPGRMPWSDNTASGHPPKYPPGGQFSNRTKSGRRVGKMSAITDAGMEPKVAKHLESPAAGAKLHTKRIGNSVRVQCYTPPKLANPGNVIHGRVGGGHMGSDKSHDNEAPFPEWLVEPFVKCFCPPGGTVLDPFMGGGTTAAVAERLGRKWIGIDVRMSEVEKTAARLKEIEQQ